MRDIITRFAPAPTGHLHLGHVVNAIYVWGLAGRSGGVVRERPRRVEGARGHGASGRGRVLLRIEDHDRQRSRAEYEASILEDLAWLGFEADGAPVRQSERGAIYDEALDTLRRRGLVYACACSRAEIGSPRYPGTCRDRGLGEAAGLGLRVRLDDQVERFVDLRHGAQEQRPSEQCGDLLVRDREGNWTYQFAATVDDVVQGVTLVVRGDDLLDSTGRQIQLARLLGRAEPPRFLHHPLIMKSATQKLSKSDRDTGVRDLRAAGWTPERVMGQALFMAGLVTAPRDVGVGELSTMIPLSREMEARSHEVDEDHETSD